MSIRRSLSIDSTSSSATIPTTQKNDQPIDSSNILYNDRQHHQTIFSNDSRFFDTSLHLYKSYRSLGYIKLDTEKSKRRLFSSSSSTLKPLPNGSNNRWRPRIAGFSSNHDIHGHPNGTLKPPFLKNQGKDIRCFFLFKLKSLFSIIRSFVKSSIRSRFIEIKTKNKT
jgi:hypothetical protein